eukprot:CAMPEP_0179283510 /NCGR_PEP_ID=MMETSP0797-20121207/38214_1 /TAXON_ID=47934 /ORGANISM="Dinophysis acuminata, Strain DAEP01" /LENGTH=214 /DNA_ID=CAMNT_0020992267 /DNA_START=88 /DNA_END=728 /DNA_ORIENTATION=+
MSCVVAGGGSGTNDRRYSGLPWHCLVPLRQLLLVLQAFRIWRLASSGAAEMELGALPPAVVVHGRRGPNSSINGVYIRDLTWQGQIGPCYRRAAATGQKGIFLYFEGEWRMGPSPAEGSVWAFARSDAASPLDISVPWEVWDGQRVAQDLDLHVSDTSVIPSVLFLSFGGEGVPEGLRAAQGMLLQQPGLWDGRPYYQHRTCEDLFLLCSVAEG